MAKVRSRFLRSGAQLVVRPSVDSLHRLGRHDAALMVANVGRTPAASVVVSMQLGHATFEFDKLELLAPGQSKPLTYRASRGGLRPKLDDTASIPNWFRIAVRGAAHKDGELRMPIAIRYIDHSGTERQRLQVLICDEEMRPKVRNR